MQAMSFAVHIPLVCFAIALPSLVVFTELLHVRTGDPLYRTLARRWSKVMIALFAVGVVTGTVLSFELGLLWPAFMARFGDVFGVAFAAEGFSFFVEAIFIAIYVYGWDRLSPRVHLLSGIPVVVAGFAGSLFVISVNGWMNHPGGFVLRDGAVVDVHPFSALFANSFFWHELIHMYLGGFMVTGFVIAAAYAWGWLGSRRGRYHRTALVIPLTLAALASPVQVVVGDWAARTVAKQQPIKLAAIEGLPTTTKGAPEHLLGWFDGSGVQYGIKIPRLLSLLAFHQPNATVTGLDAVPPQNHPSQSLINVVRFAFQAMVGIGTLLALLGVVFLAVWVRKRRLPRSVWFYRSLVLAGPLSVVALICGWVTTEVGRQPWIAYGVMRTSDAVTGAGGIPVGYATLALVYLALIAAVVWILRRLARAPLEL
jgi:cytochrome bd ubiquinol oxidase subunit I